MQTINTDYGQANPYITSNASMYDTSSSITKKDNLEEEINKSAVQVSISMNAQIILFAMDSGNLARDNSLVQNNIFNSSLGKAVENNFSLSDLGYNGKPIDELSTGEAKALIDDEGFFGIEQTSNRVADFVFNFAGYDIELLEKGKEGIIQGFDEAKKLWGGDLPEISHATQENTLALIDARIADLKARHKD